MFLTPTIWFQAFAPAIIKKRKDSIFFMPSFLLIIYCNSVFNLPENPRIRKLEEWDKDKEYDRLGLQEEYTEFLGNRVVCHSIPIRPGRSLAVIVESAAVNHRQKKMGYNAAQELYNRVQKSLAKKKEEQKK